MRLKRLISAFIACAMLVTFMPMQAFAASEVDNAVTATKTLVGEMPDANGNYTIQLTVQGNPVTSTTTSKADVVLVVDNSGSMATSVGSACGVSKEKFMPEEHLLWITYTCPNCGAKYTSSHKIGEGYVWDERPDTCTGEIGAEPRIETAQKVGKKFASSILNGENDNQMAVIGFSHGNRQGGATDQEALKVCQGLTNNFDDITNAIDDMEADGGTNYSAALQQAYNWLYDRTDKTRPAYVIFISDGAPGLSGESIDNEGWDGSKQAAALKHAGVNLYTIGIALDENEDEYLESLASDAQHYHNVTGRNYDDELADILDEWADEINTVPAGTNAVMTDVISDKFTLVSDSQSNELQVGKDGKTLTWNIGDIPEEQASVQFKVHPNDGVSGPKCYTNKSVTLTYTNTEGKSKTLADEKIGVPYVTISAPTQKHEITVEVVNGSAKYNDQAVSSPISIDEGDNATISFEANAGYALDAVTVDGQPAELTVGEYTLENVTANHIINVVFAEDKIGGENGGGDGIPDKYQATATYKVENGTWSDGTTEDKTEVVTLLNDAGNWSEFGKGTLQHKPEVGDYPAEGYEEGSWNKNDTEITADTEFIYSYRETGEIDPPVTPEWDVSKSKTATNLVQTEDGLYESDVKLSLPAAEYSPKMEVVFVMDGTSYQRWRIYRPLIQDMVDQLKDLGNIDVSIGFVTFGNTASSEYPLKPVEEVQVPYFVFKSSGTNIQSGVRAGRDMLASGSSEAEKYLILLTDGGAFYWLDEDGNSVTKPYEQGENGKFYDSTAQEDTHMYNNNLQGLYSIAAGTFEAFRAQHKSAIDAFNKSATVCAKGTKESELEGQYIYYTSDWSNKKTYPYTNMEQAVYNASEEMVNAANSGIKIITVGAYDYYPEQKAAHEISNLFLDWTENVGKLYKVNTGDEDDTADNAFEDVKNELIYLISAGSEVVDVIGSGSDYNFDFVDEVGALSLKVGNEILTAEKIADDPPFTDMNATSIYGFSREGEFGNYPFVLLYYANGQDGKSDECFVWKINENVSKFAPVQLTYTVKLTNPQTKPGTYGEYDADGSEEKGSLYTNNSATLYPVDSNGVAGAPETFAKPTVSYTIEDTTITVTFRPGNHGTLRNAQADGTVRYSDIEEGKGLGADQSVPRVDEDDDWEFTEWLCTEGSDNMEGRTYTAAEIADLVFTVDTDFVAQYEEESGGGGAHHPDARDDDDDDNDRDDDDEEEIIDEEIPLAETPWLNTVDHYAYIVGYPEDYVTGQPTEDESRWPVKPQANISRAEVATIFFRLLTDEARDQFWMTTNNFPDVAPDAWYNNAISTMVNAGIIQGYEDGTFRPNNNITRAEFAAIASRFMSSGYDVEEDLFTDIANHWARENINDAAMTQWIHGYPDGTFLPDQAITRAEAVTLVNNVLQRKPDADHMFDSMIKWPDNPESAWYYEAIQEATNSHDYDLFEDAEYETWTALRENRDWAALEKDWVNTHRTGGEVA